MNDTALVEIGKPAPAVVEGLSVNELLAHVAKIKEVLDGVLKEGEHYGPSFPGDDKKNLLKPGADKLKFVFRLAPEYKETINDLPNGHRDIRIKTILRSITTGTIIAEGLGSCSTMEGKYRWRNSARKCPACGKEAIIKGKAEYGGGWVCYKKKDGCGATYEDNDPDIVNQVVGKVENPDIADTWNTVYKMAKKRSDVDATITALAASDIFTQDADELPTTEENAPATKKPATKKPAEKNPEKSPAFDPIEERMKKAQSDVATYVTSQINDKPAFSDEEKASARAKLKNLDGDEKGIFIDEKNAAYLESVALEYKKALAYKIEEIKYPPPSYPALDEAADKAFKDDMPGEPSKPAPKTTDQEFGIF
jgi:hypothetical protein